MMQHFNLGVFMLTHFKFTNSQHLNFSRSNSGQATIVATKDIYSRFSRLSTARGSCTGLVTVGLAKV